MIPVGILSQGTDSIGAVTSLGSMGNNVQLPGGTNSFTKNSFAIGAAAFDRMIVVDVGVAAGDFLGNVACTGVTCNGLSMTAIGNTTATQSGEGTLFYALVPTGTTANFVFTFASSADARVAQIWAYKVTGYSGRAPTVIDANALSGESYAIQAGDSLISGAAANADGSYSFATSSMTGFTINANSNVAVSGSTRYAMLLAARKSDSAAVTQAVVPPSISSAYVDSQRRYYAIWRHV